MAEQMDRGFQQNVRDHVDAAGVTLQVIKTQLDDGTQDAELLFKELGEVMQTMRRLRFSLIRFIP